MIVLALILLVLVATRATAEPVVRDTDTACDAEGDESDHDDADDDLDDGDDESDGRSALDEARGLGKDEVLDRCEVNESDDRDEDLVHRDYDLDDASNDERVDREAIARGLDVAEHELLAAAGLDRVESTRERTASRWGELELAIAWRRSWSLVQPNDRDEAVWLVATWRR